VKLRMTCGPYDRSQALIDGEVKPRGIDLDIVVDADDVKRQSRIVAGEFDAGEFFIGAYIADLPRRELGFTAIPIFVKRMFRHSYMYLNRRSGVTRAADLNGKRVGIQNWLTTAALWSRGILSDEYGVDLASITWVALRPVNLKGWVPPPWLRLEILPAGTDQLELLASGNIDAAITTETWAPGIHPAVDFLFPNYAQEERAYYARTRCFPIMHVLVIRTSLLESQPWVARSMFDAWQESKRLCYERLEWQRIHLTSMWFRALWEEERAAAGLDIYPWGFRSTRHEVERLLRYAHEQAFTPRRYDPEEIFWPSLLDT
jgi:4,5-dihydroxyphthalate decarboxylase